MFRCVAAGDFRRLFQILRFDQEGAVFQNPVDGRQTRQRCRLPFQLFHHPVEKFSGVGNQNRLFQSASVFRLGEHVGCGKRRIRRAVRHNHDFRRSRDHVDRHRAVDHLLRRRNVGVARADDLIHLFQRLCSVGHRGDRVGSAEFPHLRRSRLFQRVKRRGVDLPVFHHGSRRNDAGNSCRTGDRHRMYRGGDQRRGPPGNVAADALHRKKPFSQRHARTG